MTDYELDLLRRIIDQISALLDSEGRHSISIDGAQAFLVIARQVLEGDVLPADLQGLDAVLPPAVPLSDHC